MLPPLSLDVIIDIRRMNVAITRAKSSLFILGNAATLERSNETWREIVADSKARNIFAEVRGPHIVLLLQLSFVLQVDVSYFTAPSNMATGTPLTGTSPRKSKQTKPALPVPQHPDLSTPKEFKAAALTNPPKSSSSEPLPVNDAAPTPLDKQKGKRKLEEMADPKPDSSHPKSVPPAPSATNTRPLPAPHPPRKRPKQSPALFIPKNKNKVRLAVFHYVVYIDSLSIVQRP